MKTERVTLLTTPQFKTFLNLEARREGISVAELIRTRCEHRPAGDEAALAALTTELRKAVGEARRALRAGLDEADAALNDLRATSHAASRGSQLPARRSRKATGSAA
jgi:hypothetical protein